MKKIGIILFIVIVGSFMTACGGEKILNLISFKKTDVAYVESDDTNLEIESKIEAKIIEVTNNESEKDIEYDGLEEQIAEIASVVTLNWDDSWEYADYSMIHEDSVTLYRAIEGERKNLVVSINAGHGTAGGTSVKTMCHPDGTPKVTGGSTQAGATYATAVAGGTQLLDGTPEAQATLDLALVVKDTLLQSGYDVLMIRESEDVQLDNVARTVFSNNNADCHISLHYDSTENDKGFFVIVPPNVESYKKMEPVASHWQEHEALGDALLKGMEKEDVKIYGNGKMGLDLTQISYSTIPSVDVEVGDRASDHSAQTLRRIADGIKEGLDVWSNGL